MYIDPFKEWMSSFTATALLNRLNSVVEHSLPYTLVGSCFDDVFVVIFDSNKTKKHDRVTMEEERLEMRRQLVTFMRDEMLFGSMFVDTIGKEEVWYLETIMEISTYTRPIPSDRVCWLIDNFPGRRYSLISKF